MATHIDDAQEMLAGEDSVSYRKKKPPVEKAGFSKAYHALTFWNKLSSEAYRVYLAYRSFADIGTPDETYIGVSRLAAMMGMSEPTIKRTRAELVRLKLITIESRGYGKTRMVYIEDEQQHEELVAVANALLAERPKPAIEIKNDPSLRSKMIPLLGSKMIPHNKNNEEEREEEEPSTTSLFAQPVDSLQAAPTASASSRKKEPKQEQPVSSALCQPDVPGSTHKEMFAALADLCMVDPNLVNGQLGATSKRLRKAGYTVADLERFGQWWYANNFRGKRGEPPTLGSVVTDLPRSVAPPPAAPTEHRYEVDTLRDWLKQWAWEEWKRVIAVQLGELPSNAIAFREWYASEYDGFDETGLRQWWREQEQARKETDHG